MRNYPRPLTHLAALVAAVTLTVACAANTRQTAIAAALVTVDAARDGFLAYDAHEQITLVNGATTVDDARAKLVAYRASRDAALGPGGVITAAYRSIAAAAAANTDQSVASMQAALVQLAAVIKPYLGGGK